MKENAKLTLYYDGQCPFCTRYSDFVKLRRHCDIDLRNAREYADEIDGLKQKGFNINHGMILLIEDRVYLGKEVLAQLRHYTKSKNSFEKLVQNLFTMPRLMKVVYPVIKSIRYIVLKILARETSI